MVSCIECHESMRYERTQGKYWIYVCPNGHRRTRSEDHAERLFDQMIVKKDGGSE